MTRKRSFLTVLVGTYCPRQSLGVAALPEERRDTSAVGVWNRKKFETSVEVLRLLGLSPRSVEHCRRLARKTGRLPHELVAEIVEEAILDVRRAV